MDVIRKQTLKEFDGFVGGKPLFDHDSGPMYGRYNTDNDTMEYGFATNGGFAANGYVKYDHSLPIYENVETLVDEAKRYLRRCGWEVNI